LTTKFAFFWRLRSRWKGVPVSDPRVPPTRENLMSLSLERATGAFHSLEMGSGDQSVLGWRVSMQWQLPGRGFGARRLRRFMIRTSKSGKSLFGDRTLKPRKRRAPTASQGFRSGQHRPLLHRYG
jgi:hypothetical protein